jgi:hypothetical protein
MCHLLVSRWSGVLRWGGNVALPQYPPRAGWINGPLSVRKDDNTGISQQSFTRLRLHEPRRLVPAGFCASRARLILVRRRKLAYATDWIGRMWRVMNRLRRKRDTSPIRSRRPHPSTRAGQIGGSARSRRVSGMETDCDQDGRFAPGGPRTRRDRIVLIIISQAPPPSAPPRSPCRRRSTPPVSSVRS